MLGVNGTVTICHGSAGARAICNAVRNTAEAVDHHINELIVDAVAKANDKLATAATEPVAAEA